MVQSKNLLRQIYIVKRYETYHRMCFIVIKHPRHDTRGDALRVIVMPKDVLLKFNETHSGISFNKGVNL